MSFSNSIFAPLRLVVLLASLGLACASSGGSADSPDAAEAGLDCEALEACDDKLQCSGGAQCFKLKSCPGFVCATAQVACNSECSGKNCLLLESQPMLLSCR